MKTRQYFSNDLRSAVLTIRDELGSNAIILSHKKSEHGVEVIAAVEELPQADHLSHCTQSFRQSHPTRLSESAEQPNADRQQIFSRCKPAIERVNFYKTGTCSQNSNLPYLPALNGNDSCTTQCQDGKQCIADTGCNNTAPGFTEKQPLNQGSLTQNSLNQRIMDSASMSKAVAKKQQDVTISDDRSGVTENQAGLNNLMALIEQQVTEHAWGDVARKHPLRARLIRQLLKLDIHPLIIQRVTDALSGDKIRANSIMPHALALIANQLPIYKEDITACGGTVALFGTTGAGKTTTIAKMAARFALRHGREQLALVTIDNQRIAAHEQLRIYSDILGISFRVAGDSAELLDTLNEFSEKSLVLIDTAGMGPKDIRASGYQQLFSGVLSQVRNFLVLPATAHRSVLEQSASAFRSIKLDGSIFTKLDEAASLGGPLSVAILNNLPVAYYSDGQKIPDDFHLARAHNLVSRAVGVADQLVETQSVKARSQDQAGIEANVSI
jgi:flagellar biosynthesis protein FlhF